MTQSCPRCTARSKRRKVVQLLSLPPEERQRVIDRLQATGRFPSAPPPRTPFVTGLDCGHPVDALVWKDGVGHCSQCEPGETA